MQSVLRRATLAAVALNALLTPDSVLVRYRIFFRSGYVLQLSSVESSKNITPFKDLLWTFESELCLNSESDPCRERFR